jgi:hypothetical protein
MDFVVKSLVDDNKKIESSIEGLRTENRETWGLMIKYLSNIKES